MTLSPIELFWAAKTIEILLEVEIILHKRSDKHHILMVGMEQEAVGNWE